MSSALLAAAGGSLLSILFSYIPGLSNWYDQQTGVVKRLTMLVGIVVVAVAAFVVTCSGIALPWQVSCTQNGLADLGLAVFAALAANQTTYPITPKPERGQG